MSHHDDTAERALKARLAYLLDLDISPRLRPEERLLLAVLRQAVVDYFGDDPLERLSAALYFARSPLYRMTLRQFGLPDHTLPEGVDLSVLRREVPMNAEYMDPLRLETLVRRLSGTQLKVVLTMGLLSLPATTRKISLNCGLGRATVMMALDQLSRQGLVQRNDDASHAEWSLGDEVWRVLARVLGDGPDQIDHS